jgi:hypothetical protein
LSNTTLQNSTDDSCTNELLEEIVHALESKQGFVADSEVGMILIQKCRVVTMEEEYSPRDLLMKVMTIHFQNLNKIFDQHEQSLQDMNNRILN